MTRIREKVKDLIEVRSYESVVDFRKDPSATLSGYHFTDITSQLMATWLDALVDFPTRKINAKALAGYRGVGKSHFLSAFSAIVSTPELRSGIVNTHVASSAHHLMRKRYPVALVKRGTLPTLEDELREAIAEGLDLAVEELPSDIKSLIEFVDEKQTEVPLVIIVDTALEREQRVARDDGEFLGILAEIIQDRNLFVCVALDDDITDADGINAAIAGSYTIDYLDQEHLYRIVDSHIFRKHKRAQTVIADIYAQFRSLLPAFKWSEPRFTSLYPLHPAILEVAPFIRLYAPEFALLGFASEAGARILGRPANSLIALDEVFDKVEKSLRKAPDLSEAFETYDAINKEIVSLISVMERLQAKLILKALFVLSLDGGGTTPNEIAASVMIFDEEDPSKSESVVSELLETFVSIFPDKLHRKEEGEDVRFSFRVAEKDDLMVALTERLESIPNNIVPQMLNRFAKERFSDWNLEFSGEVIDQAWTDCHLLWKGSQRKARLSWNWGADEGGFAEQNEGHDLEVQILDPLAESRAESPIGENYCWKPASLTKEEIDTIGRYHLLLNDEAIKEKFEKQIRATGHTHSQNIANIWERVFLTDARIQAADAEERLPAETVFAQTVGEVLSLSLKARFEDHFPEHPVFASPLEHKHVSVLVNDLFSGAKTTNVEVQRLAEEFALPLGLVSKQGDSFVLSKEEDVFALPTAMHVLRLFDAESESDTVTLAEVFEDLSAAPFGLVKEAQQLILAGLVAHRQIEFVTSEGDRINRRSLDLKMIWDDISGIARPANVLFSSERLNEWAQVVTGLDDKGSLEEPDYRVKVKEGLTAWASEWDESDILARFAMLPDELLNTKIWHTSVSVERAFGNVADSVRSLREEAITLEDALQRIADCFSDADSEYAAREKELDVLANFIESASQSESILAYISVCELTGDSEIEGLRKKLLSRIESGGIYATATTNKEIEESWEEFRNAFSKHFAIKHDSIMKSHQLQEKFDEFTKSDQWWEFERLASMPLFQEIHIREVENIFGQLRELDCSFDVRSHLKEYPFCACSFYLTKIREWEELPERLIQVVEYARSCYRKTLSLVKSEIVKGLDEFVEVESENPAFAEAADTLLDMTAKEKWPELFSTEQLAILGNLLSTGRISEMASAEMPKDTGITSAMEMRSSLGEWLDNLPAEPVLIKLN